MVGILDVRYVSYIERYIARNSQRQPETVRDSQKDRDRDRDSKRQTKIESDKKIHYRKFLHDYFARK